MAWQSRTDKLPPSSFFTMIAAYLQQAYPDARISRDLMTTLRPYFIEAWRNGKNAASAAQTTCSCNGREVIPSPVVGIQIAKGSVRPPKGAQRGDVFGADELRQPAPVERLQKSLNRLSRQDQKQQQVEGRWINRAMTSRSPKARDEAVRKQAATGQKREEMRREAQQIEAEINKLRSELNRVPVRRASALLSAPETVPAKVPPAAKRAPANHSIPVVAESRPAAPAPAEQIASPSPEPLSKRRGRKPKQDPSSRQATDPSQAPPVADAQSVALLGAMQGLLPGIAKQLADQIREEEGKEKK